MVRLAFVFLALLLPATAAAAPVLRVSLPEGLACPSPDELLKSLSRRFGTDRIALGQPSENELGLSVTAPPGALELELVSNRGEAPYRRRLPSQEGSCADLAETIGLLVDAWLRDLPWHGAGFLRDVPEVVRPGTPVAAPPPPPPPQRASAPPPSHHILTLRLGGGASLGSDLSNFGPEGTLSADLGLWRGFGAAVFVSALENASAKERLSDATTGSISAWRQVIALAGRYAFVSEDANGLRVFAGLALEAFEARSKGFSHPTSNVELAPAGFMAGLWQQRLWGRLSGFAQLSATIGPNVDFDVIEGGIRQHVLTLPAGRLDLSLGLALRLF